MSTHFVGYQRRLNRRGKLFAIGERRIAKNIAGVDESCQIISNISIIIRIYKKNYHDEMMKTLPQSVEISFKYLLFHRIFLQIQFLQFFVWKFYLNDLVQSSLFSLRIRFNNKWYFVTKIVLTYCANNLFKQRKVRTIFGNRMIF